MNDEEVLAYASEAWDRDIMPTLQEYVAIPNVSPVFEENWEELGHMQRAVELLTEWSRARKIPGLTVEVHEIGGKTPVIIMEIPPANGGAADDTVLLYGHLDKQPELFGWRDGLAPWSPVVEGDRLYGRGAADDGYATFASLVAIETAQAAGFPHTRCVVLIEASEESGSRDLPGHIDALKEKIGTPSLVVCLDSGCADYEHLWITTSLRGLLAGELEVSILSEGVHSGDASGVVPSTFRIARQILSRIENEETGEIVLDGLAVDIPADRIDELKGAADVMPKTVAQTMPFLDGAQPVTDDAAEQLINHTWRPMLEITGADGLPPCDRAGNVLRASTSLYLSLRLPPTRNALEAEPILSEALTSDPPYGAHVTYRSDKHSQGWNAPPFAPWLWDSLQAASHATFGSSAHVFGEGGTISFMAMLGDKFPEAQFAILGVLGPGSNAHGPNEFLHLPTGRKLTAVLAHLLRDHAGRAPDAWSGQSPPLSGPIDTGAEQELLVRLGAAMTVAGESIDEVGVRLESIGHARGVSDLSVVVLPTALFVQTSHATGTRVQLGAFTNHQARLDQISRLYDALDHAEDPAFDAHDGIDEVDRILAAPPPLGPVLRTFGLGILSVGFSLMLQPTIGGVVAAFVLGIFVGLLRLLRIRGLEAVLPVLATFLVATIVFAASKHITTDNPVRTILPPLVTFLPGAVLTTGMRDLSAGQVISGTSRLVFGFVTMALLAFGIVAAATLVGVPTSLLLDEPVSRLGPWAPWLALFLIALGTHLHHCAPRRAMPWILLVLVVAHVGQIAGAASFSAELSSFFGALAMTPVVLWIERLPAGPPSLVTFLPAFWLLVPGAAGLIGVTEIIGTDSALGPSDFSEAIGAVIAISLGVLIGTAVFRAGRQGYEEAARTLPSELRPPRWIRRTRR